MEIGNLLWIEKYRPKTLDEMVLNDETKQRFQKILSDPQSMPHLLFIGTPGSGKTTLARILIDSIVQVETDLLTLNGSDQRGIETFRTTIPEFLSVAPFVSPIKIVFIDESDNLTDDAKKIFRALLERYHSYGRFILTANEDTFTPAIKSRFEIVKFQKLPKEYILNFCKHILESEKIEHDETTLQKVIDVFYPDVRKIVGALQQNSYSGKLELKVLALDNETQLVNMLLKLIKAIIDKDNVTFSYTFNSISEFVTNNYVDLISVYKILFNRLSYKLISLKIVVSKYANKTVNSISPVMMFYEFLHELINATKAIPFKVDNIE